MGFNLNRVMVAGNLTRDPQVKTLDGGNVVANFGIAVNHNYKNKSGEKCEDTTFVECEAWGRTGELVGQYLSKGSGCFVEGRLRQDEWQDKEGKTQRKTKVVADSVQFIGKKSDGANVQEANVTQVTHTAQIETKPAGPGLADEIKAKLSDAMAAQAIKAKAVGNTVRGSDAAEPPF